MRNLLIFIATLSLFTGIAVSAPTVSITDTDAPGTIPSANLFLIKNYDASHLYAGNMLINIVDDGTFATKSFSDAAQFSFEYEVWDSTIRTNPKEGSATLTWGVDVGFTTTGNSTGGATYQLWVQENGVLPGSEGHAVFFKIDDYSNDYYTTNYANYIPVQDSTLGSNIQMTSPVEVDNGNNFLGIDDYTLVADGVSSDNLSYYVGIGSNTLRQLHEVYFYGTTDAGEDASADNLLATALIDGSSNISALANFAASGNRTNRIRPYGYDPAGNEYAGTDSAELLGSGKKWLALGQFGDDSLFGDNLIAGNWLAGTDYVSAGNSIDLLFFQTDFYGQRLLTATSGANIDFVTSSMNATTSFSGNAPTSSIPLATQDEFSTSGNGTVEYLDVATFYMQETIKIKPAITGASDVYIKESPEIVIKHNRINDIVFATSATLVTSGSSNVAVNDKTPSLTNATAGVDYSVSIAAIDAYQNITNTPDYGQSGNVNVSGNFNAGYADGYEAFGGTALDYASSYSGNYFWAGNAGVIDITDITLYRAESNTLILNTSDISFLGNHSTGSDNTTNDNLQLTVDRNAANVIVFFDDDDDHTNGLLASANVVGGGNELFAGNTVSANIYGIVSDLYGNPDTSSTNIFTLTAITNSDNQMYSRAYRNDATNLTGTGNTAIAGNLVFTHVRADLATPTDGTSGNSALFPYTALALVVESTNVPSLELSYSPPFIVSANASTNVYFTNSDNQPLPLSQVNNASFITAMAGNNLDIHTAMGDEFGNVDLGAAANVITLVTTALNDAPDGTTAPGNTTTGSLLNVGSDNIEIIPYAYQTDATLTVTLNGSSNTINETTGNFTVAAGEAMFADFVDSSGNYSSGNTFAAGNVSGNGFILYVGALDQYSNTVTTFSEVDATLSVNTTSANIYSPSGNNVATFTSVSSFTNGVLSVNATIYDASSTTKIDVSHSGNLTGRSSPEFDVGPNTGSQFIFLDVADISNDEFTGDSVDAVSDNILSTVSSTQITAGTSTSLNVAYVDAYGNLDTAKSGGNVDLVAGTPAPGDAPDGTSPVYSTGNLLSANAITTVDFTLYDATTSAVGVAGNTASGSGANVFSSASALYTVVDTGASLTVQFVTSSGANVINNPTFEGDTSTPIGTGIEGEALDDIYVAFVDQYGNVDTDYAGTGNVVINSANVESGLASTISTTTVAIGLSSNISNGIVYFDPGVTEKQVILSSPPAAGNVRLQVYSNDLGTSGNSNSFYLGDSVAPSVAVTYPNGGEEFYPGTFNIGWTANDTNLTGIGNFLISLSLDGGVTYSENITTTGNNAVNVYAWTVSANQATDTARIRVQVLDDTGNVGEDFSDADFKISPSSSVIDYAVGDADSDTINVFFREPIYSPNVDLAVGSFVSTNVSVSAVSHTGGDSSAILTLSGNLLSDNVDIATLAPTTTNSNLYFSPNSDGSSPYTSGLAVAAVNVHQLSVESLGIVNTTATSSQNVMGLRLVGWDEAGSGNSYLLKQINVTITQVSGVVTTSDFQSASDNALTSGIGLYDANGNVLVLDSAPTMAIGSSFGLAYSGNLPSTPITGAGNYNFYVGIQTSDSISDAVPDSFTVTIDSVEIIDSSTADNIQKVYVPHGTRVTDPIVTDVTAPSVPTFTMDDPVTSGNVSSVSLAITGQAGYDVSYSFFNEYTATTNVSGNFVDGNVINTITGNVFMSGLVDDIVTETVSVNLLGFSGNTTGSTNVTFSVNVSALDSVGNGAVATGDYVYDLTAPSSGNISTGNINLSTNTMFSIELTDLDSSSNVVSIVFTDDTGFSATYTASINGSVNITLSNIDISTLGLADGNITYALDLKDQYGNTTSSNLHSGNAFKDTVAPTVSSVDITSDEGNFDDLLFQFVLDDAVSSTNLTYYVTNESGNTATGNLSGDVVNVVGAGNIDMSTFADGNITITANAMDQYTNVDYTLGASNVILLDTTAPSVPNDASFVSSGNAAPVLTWLDIVESSSDITYTVSLYTSTNVLYDTFTASSNRVDYFVAGNSNSGGNILPLGTYSWNLTSSDNYSNTSANSANVMFTVAEPSAPTMTAPIGSTTTIADPTFYWNDVVDSARFQLEVTSDNVTFTPLFAQGNVTSSQNSFGYSSGNNELYTSSDNYLAAGTYYWRIKTIDVFGYEGSWSTNGVFVIANPAAPALVTPINNDSGVNNADATFGWTSVSDNALISIQVSSDNVTFTPLLAEGNVASSVNSFVFSSADNDLYTSSDNYLAAGNYYWRAKTTDIYGNEGNWSGNGEFSVVDPSAPSLTSPISSAVSSADAMFSWGSVTNADNYTVYLGQDSSGNTWDYTVTISGTSLDYNATTNTFLAATPTFTTEYYWSVATTDIYGNTGEIASIENFAVEKPDAPASLISPIDREATTATPNFRWSTVTDAVSYYITVTSEDSSFTVSSGNVTTANVILGSSLSDNVYFWSVKSIDQYGNESLSSDNAEFSVNIPMLVYAVGDIDSNEVVAVFNKSVYSNDNETGALLVDNIDVDALGGASQVTHLAGETELTVLTAQELTSGNSSDSLNEVAFGPSTTTVVYGKGGALASTSNVMIRQVSAATNVVTADGLNFGDTDGLEIMSFKVGGWSGSNVKLKAINLVITPLSGSVATSDFESQASVLSLSSNGTAIATTLGSASFVGSSQTLTLDTSYEVESDTVSSPNFDLSIVPSSTTSTDSTAKAFKVEIESLLLEIDSADATRLVAGDTETSNIIMTSVTLDTTSTGNLTTDETITITATNASATGTFSWTQLSGTTVDVVNSDSAAMNFEAEVAGTYEFQLSYIRNGYEIVRTVSMDIIEKAQEDALDDLVATAASLTTDDEFNEAFEVFASFSANAVSGQEENLISAANSLLGQLVNVGFNPTSTQLDDLFAVVDNSTSSSTNLSTAAFGAAQDVLGSMDELPATAAHAQVGFKVFSKLIDQDTTNLSVSMTSTQFNEIVASLGSAASKSLVTSGSKSINVDSSSNVKFSSSRLNSGETTTTVLSAGTTELLSVTLSSDTLAELTAAGAGNSLMLSASIVQDTTSAANLASKVYSIDVMETDGDTASAVSVSGLTNGIQIKIVIDNFVASQAYEVRFRSAGDVAFQTDSTFVTTVSNGVLTVTTTHLTEFAVFESDAGVTSGGGGGGGCLLK